MLISGNKKARRLFIPADGIHKKLFCAVNVQDAPESCDHILLSLALL